MADLVEAQSRRVRGQHQIALQRQAAPEPQRAALHERDADAREVAHSCVRLQDEPEAVLRRHAGRSLGLVPPEAEVVTCASEHEHVCFAHSLEGLDELLHHRSCQAVPRVGAIEGHVRGPAVAPQVHERHAGSPA